MSNIKGAHRWIFALPFFFGVPTVHNAVAVSPPLQGVQGLSAGDHYTCAIVNGGAQCWGTNDSGQLGDGTIVDKGSPVPLKQLSSGVTAMAAGFHSSCAIVNGGVRCWGDNEFGQLGNGTYNASLTPVPTNGITSGATAISVAGAYDYYIGAYDDFACAVANGGAFCWGNNDYGQLGTSVATGNSPSPVTGLSSGVSAIAAGDNSDFYGDFGHACAIVNSGAMCWGYNGDGELGNGTTMDSAAPVPVMGLSSNVSSIAMGNTHACAIVNGGAFCWGGAPGNGTMINSSIPGAIAGLSVGVIAIAAGGNHTCALVSNDAAHPVKCWGDNAEGQLGNATTATSFGPVDVSFPIIGFSVSAISTGAVHTCALLVDSKHDPAEMYCWGDNGAGELAITDGGSPVQLTPVTVPSILSGASAVSASNGDTCMIVAAGAQCWGGNATGQLGNGTTQPSSRPVNVTGLNTGVSAIASGAIEANFGYACAIVGGAVKCWGDNSFSELGNGTTTSSLAPTAVSSLGAGVQLLAAGDSSACVAFNGGAQCWGYYNNSPLISNNLPYSTPTPITGLSSGVTAMAVGTTHSCAVVNGAAECWGTNMFGELGNGTTIGSQTPVTATGLNSSVTSITAGGSELIDDTGEFSSMSCAIVSGSSWCWGSYGYNDLVDDSSLVPVQVTGTSSSSSISANGDHTCAVIAGGAWCWGSNSRGQLGDGTTTDRTSPVLVHGLASGVSAIGAGASHTCAVLTTGKAACWGDDAYGELGDGRFLEIATPQLVVLGDEIFADGFN